MSIERRKVVFIDTNALHFIGLCLQKIPSPSRHDSREQAIKAVKKAIEGESDGELKQSYKKGLESLEFIIKEEAEVLYSSVSILELVVGRGKGLAIEKAAKERIPDRMWSKFGEDEVNSRLETADLKDCAKRTNNIRSELEKLDIVVGHDRGGQDVFRLATGISSVVYLGVADCLIYAGALAARSDYFLTFDRPLWKSIARIRKDELLKTSVLGLIGAGAKLPESISFKGNQELKIKRGGT